MISDVGSTANRKMLGFAKAVKGADRAGVTAGALILTNSIRAAIAAAAPGSRLHGVGRKGAKVGAGYNVVGSEHPTALIQARGPVHFLERPTGPHTIEPRSKPGSRRRGAKALTINGDVRARVINHPGSHKPKQPFKKGVETGLPVARQAIVDRYTTAAVKGLKS
jgi:hypothetical protein